MNLVPCSILIASRFVFCTVAALTMIGQGSFRAYGQTDDFNDNNDAGWAHYDPISVGTYTVTNGTYRLQSSPTPMPTLGPGRAGSLLTGSFSDFYVAVDVVNWNDNVDQAFGVLARIGTPGLGTTTGYAYTYRRGVGATGGDLDISRIDGESPTGLTTSGNDKIHFSLGQTYRMVLIGKGAAFIARVYQLPDITVPVAELTANNDDYSNGRTGLIVYDPVGTLSTDATYDNYFAAAAEPPRIEVSYIPSFRELTVSWATNVGPFRLQFATNLSTNPILWTDIPDTIIFPSGDRLTYAEEPLEQLKVFRLIQD